MSLQPIFKALGCVIGATIFFSEIFGGIWISYWALITKRKIVGAISEGFAMIKAQPRAADPYPAKPKPGRSI